MIMARHVERVVEKKNVCMISVEKLEGNRPVAKTRRRWKDNIKMKFKNNRILSCGLDFSGWGGGTSDGLL
jgi:hypothetical protein